MYAWFIPAPLVVILTDIISEYMYIPIIGIPYPQIRIKDADASAKSLYYVGHIHNNRLL
jgi:hypothetical protein